MKRTYCNIIAIIALFAGTQVQAMAEKSSVTSSDVRALNKIIEKINSASAPVESETNRSRSIDAAVQTDAISTKTEIGEPIQSATTDVKSSGRIFKNWPTQSRSSISYANALADMSDSAPIVRHTATSRNSDQGLAFIAHDNQLMAIGKNIVPITPDRAPQSFLAADKPESSLLNFMSWITRKKEVVEVSVASEQADPVREEQSFASNPWTSSFAIGTAFAAGYFLREPKVDPVISLYLGSFLFLPMKTLWDDYRSISKRDGFNNIIGEVPADIKSLTHIIQKKFEGNPLGASCPKGILLVGPPGTGKTSLIRALAEEVQCGFIPITGADFNGMFVGSGALKVRELFLRAWIQALICGKAIIFIDEIDGVGKRTGSEMQSLLGTMSTLLTQMDGIDQDQNKSVIVIAATNNLENIDPALLRPGRFDKIIHVALPNIETRKLLFEHYIKTKPHDGQNMDVQKIAEATRNYSPADIKELTNKAALLALQEDHSAIGYTHIKKAIRIGLQEKLLKGETSVRQQIDGLDVLFDDQGTTKGFNQIIGGVPNDIKDMATMMKGDAAQYKKFGVPVPKGILLYGPPGTGKTLLAKAVAEEIGCEFIETTASSFMTEFIGSGPKRIADIFTQARQRANGGKAIIFIDELDAIGSRQSGMQTHQEARNTLNALLTQMDGFLKDDSIIVIGATNDPSVLDEALMRAGRFDKKIAIGLPDAAKRKLLLQHYSKNRPVSADVSFDSIVQELDGCNAADIKEFINTAATIAVRNNAEHINQDALDQAVEEFKRQRNSGNRDSHSHMYT